MENAPNAAYPMSIFFVNGRCNRSSKMQRRLFRASDCSFCGMDQPENTSACEIAWNNCTGGLFSKSVIWRHVIYSTRLSTVPLLLWKLVATIFDLPLFSQRFIAICGTSTPIEDLSPLAVRSYSRLHPVCRVSLKLNKDYYHVFLQAFR